MTEKQRAALEELVRTATEVHRISHRTHEAWIALAAALNDARAVMTHPDEAVSPRAHYETHEPPHCPTCSCGFPMQSEALPL
jgi:hypothetical protein